MTDKLQLYDDLMMFKFLQKNLKNLIKYRFIKRQLRFSLAQRSSHRLVITVLN